MFAANLFELLSSCALRSYYSNEINKGKNENPNEIEEMPEEAEYNEPSKGINGNSEEEDLRHHDSHPREADGDVESVGSNKSEKGR